MSKAWQIWTIFALCIVGVAATMLWLTFKTVQLDAMREADRSQTEIARQEAELQERISSALYRIDLKLLPLITRESTRPDEFYRSSVPMPSLPIGRGNQENAPVQQEAPQFAFTTPGMAEPAEFVLLNFSANATGLSSPFVIPNESTTTLSKRLTDAKKRFPFQQLAQECKPIQTTVQIAQKGQPVNELRNASNYYNPANERAQDLPAPFGTKIVANQPLDKVRNKLEQQRFRGAGRGSDEFSRRAQSTQSQIAMQQELVNSNRAIGNGVLGNGNYRNGNNALEPSTPRQQITNNDRASQTMNNSGGGSGIAQLPSLPPLFAPAVPTEVMRPLWIDDQLILARRSSNSLAKNVTIQCCWLDWEAIQESLQAEVADLLPDVKFQPVTDGDDLDLATALTTLPAQLVVDSPKLLSKLALDSETPQSPASGLKMSLLIAWASMLFAVLASAFLLRGVMRLSERRAAFVSAVTHELRTPLTTFRMYAEMLAEKMVPSEKQQEYANTLRVQADRLSHLVENVLQFARLERGNSAGNDEQVTLEELFQRFSGRLSERAAEAGMKLEISLPADANEGTIQTQPSTIEQVLFNLVDNACKYAKPTNDNRIEISTKQRTGHLQIRVRDHGPGIKPADKKRMFQAFHKSDQDAANSAPGVGLGLALCVRMARSLGGRLFYEDVEDGAMFVLELRV